MKLRHLGYIVLYGLIGAAVFLTSYLDLPSSWAAILAVGAAITIPTVNRIEAIYNEYAQRQQKRDEIRRQIERFQNRLHEFGLNPGSTEKLLSEAIEAGIEPTPEAVYQFGVKEKLTDIEPYRRDIVHGLLACREINLTDDPIKQATWKARISEILSSFDFGGLDNRTIELLGAYENALMTLERGETIQDELFNAEPENPRELSLEFATTYGTTELLAIILFSDKEKSEELRRTLGKLIARGKLSTESVNRETAERIQEELEQIGEQSTKFVVFTQILQRYEEVADAIEKFPHMRVGTKYPERGFPEEIEFMRMYIVYPEYDYRDAQTFLREEIVPATSGIETEGFVAVMPLHLRDLAIYPEPETIDEFLSGTYESLSFLKTGISEDLSEVVSDRIASEIGISKLLATIPFNVMVPEIDEREKEVIIDNYENLKAEFGISGLFDWADVDPADLGQAINRVDEDGEEERWRTIAESIVENAERYDTATFADTA